MNKSLKTIIICIFVFVITFLSGCNQKSPQIFIKEISDEQTAEASEPVILRFSWWGVNKCNEATLAAINLYNNENPQVIIKEEPQTYDGFEKKFMVQLASNSAPDLVQYDVTWLQDLIVLGDNFDFVDFNKEKSIDLNNFDRNLLKKYCMIDEKLLGLPMGAEGAGIIINRQFFQRFGLPVDTKWTWNKILNKGKEIHAKDQESYLIACDPTTTIVHDLLFLPYIYSKTGKFWAGDDLTLKVSRKDFVDAFTMLKELWKSGAMMPLSEAAGFDFNIGKHPRFLNGQVGILPAGSSFVPSARAAQKDPENLTVGASIFAEGGNTQVRFKPSILLGVNNKSQNVREAVKFADWFVNSKDAAIILKDVRSTPMSIPSRKILEDSKGLDNGVTQIVDNTLKNPQPPCPMVLYNPEVLEIVCDIIQKVGYNKMTPDQAADELTENVQGKFRDLKAKSR